MELLLWRWSTLVQATSDLMIAGFFVAIAMSTRRSELRAWVGAWLANLGALVVAIVFWKLQPKAPLAFATTVACYVFAKTLFVLLPVNGTAAFTSIRPIPLSHRQLVLAAGAFALACAMAVRVIDLLGMVQSVVIALGLGWGALALLRAGALRYSWLAMGLALRAGLAVAESAAFAIQLTNGGAPGSTLSIFLAAHSSFDTGAEWVIALGCVMTLYRSIQQELMQSNSELLAAQEKMQDLLHRDQLTGVFNRRSLPTILRGGQSTGATLLFLDLDGFKRINDAYGHCVGDECLSRFADVLEANFPGDHVVRYAGDEFIVVTRDTDPLAIADRLQATRCDLESSATHGPRIEFSVGIASLPTQGDPEAALHAADQAMYDAKARRSEDMHRSRIA